MSSEASQGAAPLVEHYVSVGAPSQLTLLDESSAANWQDRVYAPTAQKLVERVFDGRNATIMAYGQTGAAPRPSQ